MAPADPAVLTAAVASSPLHAKYAEAVDRDSAYERLTKKVEAAPAPAPADAPEAAKAPRTTSRSSRAPKPQKSTAEKVLESSAFRSAARSAATVLGREIARSIFGTRSR
jgi:hypothetical protein